MRLSSKVGSLDMKLLRRAPGVTVQDAKSSPKGVIGAATRYRISDAFREYIWRTMTKIEERVEERLLRDIYNKMDDEILKRELIQAYKRRKLNIESYGFDEQEATPAESEEKVVDKPNFDVSFYDINMTNEEMVGKLK